MDNVRMGHVLMAFTGFLVLRKLIETTAVLSDLSGEQPQTMDHTEAQGLRVQSNGPYVKKK